MESQEARREARRKRILRSSADRMKRVMGGQNDPSLGDGAQKDDTDIRETEISYISSPDEEKPVGGTRLRNPTASNDEFSNKNKSEDEKITQNTVKISPLKKTLLSTTNITGEENTYTSMNTSRSSSEAKMMLKHFEFLRIVLCFIIAFLCRRVLATGYGIFCVQTIFLPFACMETGFFFFKHNVLHNVILPYRSSVLVGLLMLCGLKPSVVQLYNKTMGYITAASEDFALFFFAFMMAHLFLV